MQIMNGWTVDWTDALAGVGLLVLLVLIGYLLHMLRKISAIDIGGECRDECACPGSGHEPQDEPAMCGHCGRYVEIGGE
jgi:hypothetical protein